MLPPFKGPHVVVQLLCTPHQSADFSQDRFSGPSSVYLHITFFGGGRGVHISYYTLIYLDKLMDGVMVFD